ncbi:hypothetical protein BH24ACT5_BH24ACT5_32150 [soil metagenome]
MADHDTVSNLAQLPAGAPGDDTKTVPMAEDRFGKGSSPIESHIEAAVERAVARLLRPYLRRICEPEPAVYTVAQAAVARQVSPDTVSRLVRSGVLARVPHLGGKILVPRTAVDVLIGSSPKERNLSNGHLVMASNRETRGTAPDSRS